MIPERKRYTLRKRARAAEETRQRIIDAARSLFSAQGYPNISLDAIAERAGISRRTIYVQFGSKAGVLAAMVDQWLAQSLARIFAALQGAEDPVRMIHSALEADALMMHEHADMLRTIRAQAASDPDFKAIFQERMQSRRQSIHGAIERLQAEGKLAGDWTVDEAADWLFAVSDFPVMDELMSNRGWSLGEATRRLIETVDAVLVRD